MRFARMTALLTGFGIVAHATCIEAEATTLSVPTHSFTVESILADNARATAKSGWNAVTMHQGARAPSILSRVKQDTQSNAPDAKSLHARQKADNSELNAMLQERAALQEAASAEQFRANRRLMPETTVPLTQSAHAGASGLFSGQGWALLATSQDYFQDTKRTIKQSEKRILSSISSLTNRQIKRGNSASGGRSKGNILLGLASAMILMIIVAMTVWRRKQ